MKLANYKAFIGNYVCLECYVNNYVLCIGLNYATNCVLRIKKAILQIIKYFKKHQDLF